jgi:dipeptidyl aminopeptidase/acylaminoacyl peptidase
MFKLKVFEVMKKRFVFILFLIASGSTFLFAQDVFTPQDYFDINYTSPIVYSPDGELLLFSEAKQRDANEKPGTAHVKYRIINLETNQSKAFLPDSLKISSAQFSPDGAYILFIYKKSKKDIAQIWKKSIDSDEMVQLSESVADIVNFEYHPASKQVFYIAKTPFTAKEKELKKRGYDFIFYEENIKNNQLYVAPFDTDLSIGEPKQLSEGEQVWDFTVDAYGEQVAYAASPKNLVDHMYMFKTIYIHNLKTGSEIAIDERKGKLGNYDFSPDGKKLAIASALNMNDHAVSQIKIFDIASKSLSNLTPSDFKGHYSWVTWKNNFEVYAFSAEGVYNNISVISTGDKQREILISGSETGVAFFAPKVYKEKSKMAFMGSTPTNPYGIYTWEEGGELKQLQNVNEYVSTLELGKQEVFTYKARDGFEIEGIIIYPVGYDASKKYPLIMYVHGGPEANHSNGWLTSYSTPGQIMAGKGYMIAYINYRASTGYGIEFGNIGFKDPAGVEFNDLADAIDYLVADKGADKDRVGMAGGSYGGYASAWFATYYTEKVKAACVFVGVTNLISKRGTTDIPYEELYVHSGKPLEEQWQMNLERSPVYWAHQSKTATLIYGGAADPRVHPTQSLELYRRMKMNNHPAVRLVQYPGEGHGNAKQVGRIDVLYRQMTWLDWYIKDAKPIDGPMPPLDLSDYYNLDWEF